MRSAHDPWLDGLPLHLPVPASSLGSLPRVFLLPGDPDRVDLSSAVLNDFHVLGSRREFRLGVGTCHGVPIGVCSTGIGGPSTEIAIVELARLGIRTVLRVGGMGSLSSGVPVGSICSVASVLLSGGAGRLYAEAAGLAGAARAAPRVSSAIDLAAAELGLAIPRISVVSADSYYLGEGRPVAGLEDVAGRYFEHLRRLDVDGIDMEADTVFTVGTACGLEVGGLLIAHANRVTDEWLEDYAPVQLRMLTLACAAAVRLSAREAR